MAEVFLGLGSNVEREKHIQIGLQALRRQFIINSASSIYESDAVGFAGAPFFNLVVSITTSLSVAELQTNLRQIESANGTDHAATRYSAKTLDIDILLYDDLVGCIDGVHLPRDEILCHAFVLWPLAEIAPANIHPVEKKNYRTLWADFDKSRQYIQLVKQCGISDNNN